MDTGIVGGPFCRFEYEPFNLNSSPAIKEYLTANGWEPDEWNYKKDARGFAERDARGNPIKSSPKLTESSYASVKGEVPAMVAKRNVLMHRKRMVKNVRADGEEKGFINILRDDGRLSADAVCIGTNTHRCRHINVVNVPSVDALYGDRLRGFFMAPEGRVLVGVDAKALEARMQAHYVFPFDGGEELADLLMNGDIHQSNADLWGCGRKAAKSPYYCLMYGGQPPKLAQTMGCSLKDAQAYFNMFWDKYTPLTMFKESITRSWEARGGKNGGYLKSIHGAKLFARSPHALVNMMFQSAGAVTVMYATILLDRAIKAGRLDAHQVIHMHDEFQIEVSEQDADKVVQASLQAFLDAGKMLHLNVPIEGDAKVGSNWKETH